MIKLFTKFLFQKKQWFSEVLSFHKKAFLHSKDLKPRQRKQGNIHRNDIILFAVMKNEAHRLRYFVDYYRKIGVDHFIFVDNGSTDNFSEIIADQNDISTYYTTASYKNSNYGMYWVNYLLLRYGCGHWCLTCDPDEFLVYPYIETRCIKELTEYLDSIHESSFFATMIDMYSDKAVEESYCLEGHNPKETCQFFDATGYSRSYNPNYRNVFVQGGVRRRVFYSKNPAKAPALNKIPLIKWAPHFAYVESMHMAIPRRLNQTCYQTKTSGALLHYKFISKLVEKIKEEEIAQQHWDDSSEYKKYEEAIKNKTTLYDSSISIKYDDWRILARYGLLNIGEW